MQPEKIVRLVTEPDARHEEAVASVVKVLEDMLEQARKGEIEGLAVALLWSDGTCGCGFSRSTSYYRLMGSIADLQIEYNKANS